MQGGCVMASDEQRTRRNRESLAESQIQQNLVDQFEASMRDFFEQARDSDLEKIDRRWATIRPAIAAASRQTLLDKWTLQERERYHDYIENFIGTVKLPVGIAGPLQIHGTFADGDYAIPLATTAAHLVALYTRGAQLISEAGGCTTAVVNEGISRTAGFAFKNLRDCGNFVVWVMSQIDIFKEIVANTANASTLIDMQVTVEGKHVYLKLDFIAGGKHQNNATTLAAEAIGTYIDVNAPLHPEYWFVESDPLRAGTHALVAERGKKVAAEIRLPAELVQKHLGTTPEHMMNCSQMRAIGNMLTGSQGVQRQFVDALAALFIACGQDISRIAESGAGMTRLELTNEGDLYASVVLPSLITGSFDESVRLPSQQACLTILDLPGERRANAFAEICAAVCLAGELAITGSICTANYIPSPIQNTGSPAVKQLNDQNDVLQDL